MNAEKVTISLGVPTIWLLLLNHLRDSGKKIDTVKRLVIGGSSCPRTLFEGFEDEFDAVRSLPSRGLESTRVIPCRRRL